MLNRSSDSLGDNRDQLNKRAYAEFDNLGIAEAIVGNN
jgi:hypothetical protein